MAATEIEHAERIAALEVKVDALTASVEKAADKIDHLLGIVEQAKGAKWALLGMGTFSGAVMTFIISKGAAILGVVK